MVLNILISIHALCVILLSYPLPGKPMDSKIPKGNELVQGKVKNSLSKDHVAQLNLYKKYLGLGEKNSNDGKIKDKTSKNSRPAQILVSPEGIKDPRIVKKAHEMFSDLNLPAWLYKKYLFFALWQWLGLLIAIFLGNLVKYLVRWMFLGIEHIAARTVTVWDEKITRTVRKPVSFMAACGFWFFSIHFLQFRGAMFTFLIYFVKMLLGMSVVWVIYRLTSVLSEFLRTLTTKVESSMVEEVMPVLEQIVKFLVMLIGTMLVLQNLGFNVVSLVAGLGLGGLAFALAAKDAASNLFGSIMIFMDAPFHVGDYVRINETEGDVEEIGFRSTRVRTFYNSVKVIPNSMVARAEIDNMSLRSYRRIKTTIGIEYNTPTQKVREFVDGIRQIVLDYPGTDKENHHIVFRDFGVSSLEILVYCFITLPDWEGELQARQKIFLSISELAESLSIRFAFPTRTLRVASMPDDGGIMELNK